jgi:hypothetical protein
MESGDKSQKLRRYTQYREICPILTEAGRLTAKKFHNVENKEELIEN